MFSTLKKAAASAGVVCVIVGGTASVASAHSSKHDSDYTKATVEQTAPAATPATSSVQPAQAPAPSAPAKTFQVDTVQVPTLNTDGHPSQDEAGDEHDFKTYVEYASNDCTGSQPVPSKKRFVNIWYVAGKHPAVLKNPRFYINGEGPFQAGASGVKLNVPMDDAAQFQGETWHNNADPQKDPDDIKKSAILTRVPCPAPPVPTTVSGSVGNPVCAAENVESLVLNFDVKGANNTSANLTYNWTAKGNTTKDLPLEGNPFGVGAHSVKLTTPSWAAPGMTLLLSVDYVPTGSSAFPVPVMDQYTHVMLDCTTKVIPPISVEKPPTPTAPVHQTATPVTSKCASEADAKRLGLTWDAATQSCGMPFTGGGSSRDSAIGVGAILAGAALIWASSRKKKVLAA